MLSFRWMSVQTFAGTAQAHSDPKSPKAAVAGRALLRATLAAALLPVGVDAIEEYGTRVFERL